MPFLIKLNLEGNSVKDIKPLANEEAFKNLKVLYMQNLLISISI